MLFLFVQKLLHGYKFPVYTTEVCPRNQEEWDERSLALNCTESNAFICLPNENLTELLEFCYTESRIRIQEGRNNFKTMIMLKIKTLLSDEKTERNFMRKLMCFVSVLYKCMELLFIIGICLFLYKRYSLLDAYDCRGFTYGCPTASHFSDEIYKCEYCIQIAMLWHWITSFTNWSLWYLCIPRYWSMIYGNDN